MGIPVLYLLMRVDMLSMNSGKAMAQALHAGNAFDQQIERIRGTYDTESESRTIDAYDNWSMETEQNTGTVLTLGVTEQEMRDTVASAEKMDFIAGIFHDPTYPLRDGETTHFIPVDTCAWVFVEDKDDPFAKDLLGKFNLHP